jgi:ribosomal-protein-alanine N-acetyltransferase
VSGPLTRPIRWWDVEALVELELVLFADDAWSAQTWWGELAQDATRRYLLVEDAGRVLAYGGVQVGGSEADVMTIAVAPQQQGRGLADALLSRLERAAADAGATALLLEVRADNLAAHRLYVRHGFERLAVRRAYYRTRSGPVDAWVMRQRPLRASGPGAHVGPRR